MKGGTLQIVWHDSMPVLSVDFHTEAGLLATAGADHDIKLWFVTRKDDGKGTPTVSFRANLAFHTTAVNVIRFSPSGELLASGADGGHLALWRLALNSEGIPTWKVLRPLSFHPKDVLDLEWSPDGTLLISGSVDNSCIIWSVAKGTPLQVLKDHLHYVQGVAWDPAGQYVATVSGDRTCRIYSQRPSRINSKQQDKASKDSSKFQPFVCQHILAKVSVERSKSTSPQVEDSDVTAQKMICCTKQHIFHDENLPTFFRRLAWSPDGSFLLVPAGLYKPSVDSAAFNTTCVVSRKDLSRPALHLPCGRKAVVAVRFCPIVFTLRPDAETCRSADPDAGYFKLPYRIFFAVATLNSLYIYETQSESPVVVFAGLHFAAITDLAWSSDAKLLAVSSQDGYCTLLAFEDGELGHPVPLEDMPPHIASHLHEARRKELEKSLEESSSPEKKGVNEEMPVMESPQPSHAVKDAGGKAGEEADSTGKSEPVPTVSLTSKPRRITPVAICHPMNSADPAAEEEAGVGKPASLHAESEPGAPSEKKPRRVTAVSIPAPDCPVTECDLRLGT